MKKLSESTKKKARKLQEAPMATPSDLSAKATRDITAALNPILADVFALYLKTKNFHWHVSGPHFRDYHLLLDEQAAELFAMTDPIAERVRKIGGQTLRHHIFRHGSAIADPCVKPRFRHVNNAVAGHDIQLNIGVTFSKNRQDRGQQQRGRLNGDVETNMTRRRIAEGVELFNRDID